MTRNFIFVFILLTIFTIINAIPFHKRAAFFGPCPNVEDTFSVKMDPDPLISPHLTTFTITGEEVTGRSIGPLDQLVVTIGATGPVQPPSVFPVCNATDCPINSGVEYSTTGTFLLNATLPSEYQIILAIGNLNTSSPQMTFINDIILACAMTTITNR
ncbi:11991_t:CDS:1 [Funneliformis mosseae]|uniref:11991_t:CDS:1 n=1 Tax=Funneliformis mosseae TaxID=27381 RepID=A0A9N9E9F3_FUNMO|nr:11991_t:CDS:1 [Funneliformis mosseae]